MAYCERGGGWAQSLAQREGVYDILSDHDDATVFSLQLRREVVTAIILLMERANEQLVQIMQNLPIRLDRFWRAQQHFYESLKLCLAEMNGKGSQEVMTYLKEKQLLNNYIAAK